MSEKISNTLIPRPSIKQAPANKQFIPEDHKKVARALEKQFADEMLKQMNKTIGAQAGGSGAEFYKSLMNNERAEMLTKNRGGLGIQDVILDDIYPRRMRNPLAYQQYEQSKNRLIKRDTIRMEQPDQEQSITMRQKPQDITMKQQSQGLPAINKTNAKEASNEQ